MKHNNERKKKVYEIILKIKVNMVVGFLGKLFYFWSFYFFFAKIDYNET